MASSAASPAMVLRDGASLRGARRGSAHAARVPAFETTKEEALDTASNPLRDTASDPLRDTASDPLRDTASNPLRDTASRPLRDYLPDRSWASVRKAPLRFFRKFAPYYLKNDPHGTKAKSRGEWYEMQIEASNNVEVPWALSLLCGAFDFQIEHHLYPTLPPNRLREIAPEVREICKKHGVASRTGSWGETRKRAVRQIARLSRNNGAQSVLRAGA